MTRHHYRRGGWVDSGLTPPATLGLCPDSSLYLEFPGAKPVARARLWPSWARLYPALERGRWYRVWDVGQDTHGVFLDAGEPRYVTSAHLQSERMPDSQGSAGQSEGAADPVDLDPGPLTWALVEAAPMASFTSVPTAGSASR